MEAILSLKIHTVPPTLALLLQESILKTCSIVVTFESANGILWCDHSNDTSPAVTLHGTICFSIFYKMTFRIYFE